MTTLGLVFSAAGSGVLLVVVLVALAEALVVAELLAAAAGGGGGPGRRCQLDARSGRAAGPQPATAAARAISGTGDECVVLRMEVPEGSERGEEATKDRSSAQPRADGPSTAGSARDPLQHGGVDVEVGVHRADVV